MIVGGRKYPEPSFESSVRNAELSLSSTLIPISWQGCQPSQRRGGRMSAGDNKAGRSASGQQPTRNPPLVIVSERGRHSEASRRIVRAQAARASAAQSRETRARNREDRSLRDGASSPPSVGALQPPTAAPSTQVPAFFDLAPPTARPSDLPSGPLTDWLTNVLPVSLESGSSGSFYHTDSWHPRLDNASILVPSTGQMLSEGERRLEEVQLDVFARRLPIAAPRGFGALQKRVQISSALLVVVSRTACFDFASPGVEQRIYELLHDILLVPTPGSPLDDAENAYPLQRYLRVACACLVIFQGHRVDPGLHHDERFLTGLEAAWAETMTLDQGALREPKSVDAALWAVFIICVTTGAGTAYFHAVLRVLMEDLQLRSWEDFRSVLLNFIYPGSFLDELCRPAYDALCNNQH